MIKEWLIQLNEIIGWVNDGTDTNIINNKIYDLKKSYNKFSYDERESLHNIIKSMVNPPDLSTMWFISFIIKILDPNFALKLLIDLISNSDFDIVKLSSIELQLYTTLLEFDYSLMRRFHEIVMSKAKAILSEEYRYISVAERHKDYIIIVTEQILGINHSPSKLVLDYYIFLQERLNMKVYLLVIPIIPSITNDEWYEGKKMNYLEELNGKVILKHKNVKIPIHQVLFSKNNLKAIKEIIRFVYESKPMFVFSMGVVSPITDIMSKFITTVADNMTVAYPISEAQILLKYGYNRDAEKETIIKNKNQKIVFIEPSVDLSPVACIVKKEQLGILKEDFAIAIVGNRLDIEINEEFIFFLEKLLKLVPRIIYVVIGNMNKYHNSFKHFEEKNRSIFLGMQDNLSSILGAMDLYLNLPRQGGGISSLMSLNVGTPVVTLDNCDVAYNVGKDFICLNEKEETDVIVKYATSEKFYKEQVQKGLDRIKQISDVDSYNKKVLHRIYDIINNV